MYKVLLFAGTVEGRTIAEFLNERQMYAVISYYYLGVSQEEIAKEHRYMTEKNREQE